MAAQRSRRKDRIDAGTVAQRGTSNDETVAGEWMSSWRQLRTRTKAATVGFTALVTGLAGWGTIKDQALLPLWSHWSQRQPHRDQVTIDGLRTGVLFSQFQQDLGESPVTVLRQDISLKAVGRTVRARDELFILDTVYIEAFVAPTQRVLGYTVTARASDMPHPIKVGSHTFGLGTMSVAEAPFSQVTRVAGVCGAHITAYYEISGTSGAELNQTYAVGFTSAGTLPDGVQYPTCAPVNDLSQVDEGKYVIGEHAVSIRYLVKEQTYRAHVPINTVAVTDAAVDLVPQMISLHPDFLSTLDR